LNFLCGFASLREMNGITAARAFTENAERLGVLGVSTF
jgi:hypothetical protein